MRRTTRTRVIAPHRMSNMIIGDIPDISTSTGSNLVPRTRCGTTHNAGRRGRYRWALWPLFAGIIVLFHPTCNGLFACRPALDCLKGMNAHGRVGTNPTQCTARQVRIWVAPYHRYACGQTYMEFEIAM